MKNALKFSALTFAMMQLAGSPALLGQGVPTPIAPNLNGPRIQFAETSFNFGKVTPTDKPQHEFIFTNTGNAVLEVTAVRPGCGCTTAGAWDHQVQPGKTGKISLQFNPANFTGPVSKGATVTCNDPAQGAVSLQFQATVWRPIEMQPQYVYFMPIEDEATNETKVVRIINHQEEAVTLQAPQSTSAAFKTELKTVLPGKEFELRVSYSGPVSNASPHGTITLNSSLAGMAPLSVTVYAMPQPALTAMPARIQLPPGPLNHDYHYPATIRNNGHTPVKFSNPTVNAEGVTVQMADMDGGKTTKFNLSFPAKFQINPGEPIELTVKTSLPKHPTFHVPIGQMAPAAPVVRPPVPVFNDAK